MKGAKPVTKKKRKRPKTITSAEAMRRLKLMVDRIGSNVTAALWAEAILEAGNKKVPPPEMVVLGARAYHTIVQSLTLTLALALARLYDPGTRRRHPNERDVASIPLIIRLLKQGRCQSRLVHLARNWTPHIDWSSDIQAHACENAIQEAIAAYGVLIGTRQGREKLKRLRNFRDKHLAHSLIDDMIKALPTYNDLFDLMDVARDVAEHARLAIQGTHEDLKDAERSILEHGEMFWDNAIKGLVAASQEFHREQ